MALNPQRFPTSFLLNELNIAPSVITTDFTQFKYAPHDFSSLFFSAGLAWLEYLYRLSTDGNEGVEYIAKLNQREGVYELVNDQDPQYRKTRFDYADRLNDILTIKKTDSCQSAMRRLQMESSHLAPVIQFENRNYAINYYKRIADRIHPSMQAETPPHADGEPSDLTKHCLACAIQCKLVIFTPDGSSREFEPDSGIRWPVIHLLHVPDQCEYRILYPRLIADEIDRYDTGQGTYPDIGRVPKRVKDVIDNPESKVYAQKDENRQSRITTSLSGPINLDVAEMHKDLTEYIEFLQKSVLNYTGKIGSYFANGKIDFNDYRISDLTEFTEGQSRHMKKLGSIAAYSFIPTSESSQSLAQIKISQNFDNICSLCNKNKKSFKLDCEHNYCKLCLIDKLKRDTQSKMILGAREGEMNFLCPDPQCRRQIDTDTIRDLLGRHMYRKYKKEAQQRDAQLNSCRCPNCNQERNPEDFINRYVQVNCRHPPICKNCVQIQGCVVCNRAYNREEVEGIMKSGIIQECYKCKQSNEMADIVCPEHDRLCKRCISEPIDWSCPVCGRELFEEFELIGQYKLQFDVTDVNSLLCMKGLHQMPRDAFGLLSWPNHEPYCNICVLEYFQYVDNKCYCDRQLTQDEKQKLTDEIQRTKRQCEICNLFKNNDDFLSTALCATNCSACIYCLYDINDKLKAAGTPFNNCPRCDSPLDPVSKEQVSSFQ